MNATTETAALSDPTLEQVAYEYPADRLAARREIILAAFRDLTAEQQCNVIRELAELEASRDTMETELSDAGFGSFGPL